MIRELLIIILAFIISALPLYMAVKLLGGKTSIFKTILVNLAISVVVGIIYLLLPYASLIAFIAILWIYREMFRLRWFKAFLAWVIQITLTFVLILILGIAVGVSLLI